MIVPRTIKCGVCGKAETEPSYGSGWVGWGEIKGLALKNDHCDGEPHICPDHLKQVFEFVDKLNGVD